MILDIHKYIDLLFPFKKNDKTQIEIIIPFHLTNDFGGTG